MIWERNAACRNAQDHGRMYLTMSVCLTVVCEVEALEIHGHHACFLFLNVNKLNDSFVNKILEAKHSFLYKNDLFFCHLELVALNNIQRSHDTSLICQYSYFLVLDVSYQGDL